MPSFISSSDRSKDQDNANARIGEFDWGRMGIQIFALLAILLLAWEGTLRYAGYQTGTEGVDSWVDVRGRVGGGKTVFVGASRIQAAIDLERWSQERKEPIPVQLALAGGMSIDFLDHLTEAKPFADGLVVAEILPLHTFDGSRAAANAEVEYLAAYASIRSSPAQRIEARFQNWLSDLLVMRNGALTLVNFVTTTFQKWAFPERLAVRWDRNRMSAMLFAEAREAGRFVAPIHYDIAANVGEPVSEEELLARFARFEHAADRIVQFGGRVLFVSLHACGERARVEEARYPRADYWDRFVASTAHPTLNVMDEASFTKPECFDGSHLDVRDAARFTTELVKFIGDHPVLGR